MSRKVRLICSSLLFSFSFCFFLFLHPQLLPYVVSSTFVKTTKTHTHPALYGLKRPNHLSMVRVLAGFLKDQTHTHTHTRSLLENPHSQSVIFLYLVWALNYSFAWSWARCKCQLGPRSIVEQLRCQLQPASLSFQVQAPRFCVTVVILPTFSVKGPGEKYQKY
jgi:hypothetical protein